MKIVQGIGFFFFLLGSTIVGLNDQEKDALATKFAPLMKLHDKERGFPSSVQWYWKQCYLKKRSGEHTQVNNESKNPLEGVLKNIVEHLPAVVEIEGKAMEPGAITAEILGNLPGHGEGYFLEPQDESVYAGQEPGAQGHLEAPIYAHIVERRQGQVNEGLVIQYMFFYPYQGALPFIPYVDIELVNKFVPAEKIGYHVGDWEHTDVYLKKVSNTGDVLLDYELSQVFYARHQQKRGDLLHVHEIKHRANDQLQEDPQGTHPIVWVGKHSHAGYPRYFMGVSSDADMVSDNGLLWPTWKEVINVGTVDKPTPGNEWIRAQELRWGNTVEATIPLTNIEYHGNSPETPSSGGWFARPGFDKKDIETTIDGKRVAAVPVSAQKVEKNKKQAGHSSYFSIEVPARMRFLEFEIEHPDASNIMFDIYEYKYGRKNKLIFENVKKGAAFAMPAARVIKNLYIDKVRLVDSVGEDIASPVVPETMNVTIFGLEE